MATHSSTLAWKIPWTEEPGGLQFMGSLRVGHNWATSISIFTFMHWRRKWQPTPVFLPGESQNGGVWWVAVYGVTQSRTQVKRLSSSSSKEGSIERSEQVAGSGKEVRGVRGGWSPRSDSEGDEGPPESSEHRNDRISRRFWKDRSDCVQNKPEGEKGGYRTNSLVFRKANSNCYSTSIKRLHMNRITHTIRIIWP